MLISTMSHKINIDQDELDVEIMKVTPNRTHAHFNSSS